ncbi:MAG TPA: phosphatase PAP2 family protein [Longimicrobiales bacterium]|nr:phosphatase PAP2 family protein [Longimicrobiales bacterium]
MTEPARTMDRIVAAYAVVSGLALAFAHRPGSWPLIALGHIALLAVAVNAHRLRGRAASHRGPAGPVLRVVTDWYPLLVLPLLYTELAVLNTSVWGGRYFDGTIMRWEEALFGGQPSVTLALAAPVLALSELLHSAYLSYYAIIYLPPLYLYLRGERDRFHRLMLPLIATFVAHYVVFVYFPVQGPRYIFPPPAGGLEAGPVYGLTHRILEAGSSQGSAFPSSHVGVSVAQTVSAFRYMPRAAPWLGAATLGLAVGAVYGGFHYAIDAVIGAAVGGALALILGRRRRA